MLRWISGFENNRGLCLFGFWSGGLHSAQAAQPSRAKPSELEGSVLPPALSCYGLSSPHPFSPCANSCPSLQALLLSDSSCAGICLSPSLLEVLCLYPCPLSFPLSAPAPKLLFFLLAFLFSLQFPPSFSPSFSGSLCFSPSLPLLRERNSPPDPSPRGFQRPGSPFWACGSPLLKQHPALHGPLKPRDQAGSRGLELEGGGCGSSATVYSCLSSLPHFLPVALQRKSKLLWQGFLLL